MQRGAKKPEPDVEGAKIAAAKEAARWQAEPRPEWWGPVADVYGYLGLHVRTIQDQTTTAKTFYSLHPEADFVLVDEALGGKTTDHEVFVLAQMVAASMVSAGQPLSKFLRAFVSQTLQHVAGQGGLKIPPSPTGKTSAMNWGRDVCIHRLMYLLCSQYNLKPTHGIEPHTLVGRKQRRILDSASKVIGKAFRDVGFADVSDERGMQIHKNGNVERRLAKALSERSETFHRVRAAIARSVTLQMLEDERQRR